MDRVRSAHPSGDLSRSDVQREISRSVKEILSAGDTHTGGVRSDIAMVLREIDAGGTVFRAAIEAGDEELQREVLAAVGAVSAEFGEMEFMLADLARAECQRECVLAGQRTGHGPRPVAAPTGTSGCGMRPPSRRSAPR